MDEATTDRVQKKSRNRKWFYISIISCLVISAAAIGLFVAQKGHSNPDALPNSVVSQITEFTTYYFTNNSLPDGLHLKPGSTSYSGGVLVFSLVTSRDETIGITEQALPAEFTNSKLQGQDSIETANGKATITSLNGGRTTGSLVTKDGTFILLNTQSPVELSTIKDILRGFTKL